MVESNAQVFASSHVEYINREKAFANRGDCIFNDHKLPKWAADDPKIFFAAADKYEGKSNRRYVEIEFALPNVLTLFLICTLKTITILTLFTIRLALYPMDNVTLMSILCSPSV